VLTWLAVGVDSALYIPWREIPGGRPDHMQQTYDIEDPCKPGVNAYLRIPSPSQRSILLLCRRFFRKPRHRRPSEGSSRVPDAEDELWDWVPGIILHELFHAANAAKCE